MFDKKKFFTLFCYCFSFGQLGFAFASMGPILPILVDQVNQPLSTLGYIFPGRSVAYLLGSLVGGLIIHKVNGHWLLASGLFFGGIGTFLVPYVSEIWILSLCIAVQGVAMGFLDTGVNVLTASLYGEKAAPYLQLIHFSFGFGAFISPLLIELSLVKADTYKWAFVGVAPTFVLIAIALVVLPTPSAVENKTIKTKKGGYTIRQWSLVLMGSFLLLLYVGCELSISGYLLVYCKEKLGMSQSEGDYTSFSFWFALAVGRLLAIPISMKLSGAMMLMTNYIGGLISLILIVVFPNSSLVLKICMPILGISMSSVYPSVMTMIEEYMQLTGKFATILVIGGAVGELAIPFIMAAILDAPNHPWIALMYILLISNFISIVVMLIFKIVGKQVKESKRASQISFAKLPSTLEPSVSDLTSSEMISISKSYVKLEDVEEREEKEEREREEKEREEDSEVHQLEVTNLGYEETVPLKK